MDRRMAWETRFRLHADTGSFPRGGARVRREREAAVRADAPPRNRRHRRPAQYIGAADVDACAPACIATPVSMVAATQP
jgi:hypothetical protein